MNITDKKSSMRSILNKETGRPRVKSSNMQINFASKNLLKLKKQKTETSFEGEQIPRKTFTMQTY